LERPLEEAIIGEVAATRAERTFLMISGTLNRETNQIAKLRCALGY
jgi:maleylacetate reductase